MSSSHLFLGLPIALLVLYLELRSLFHSAAFFSQFPFHFFVCPVPATNLCTFHLVQCVNSASLYVFGPVFLFNLNCIHFLIRVFFKCHFTVHIIFRLCALTIVAFVISATYFGDVNISLFFCGLNILLFNFFVFPLVNSCSACVGGSLRCSCHSDKPVVSVRRKSLSLCVPIKQRVMQPRGKSCWKRPCRGLGDTA